MLYKLKEITFSTKPMNLIDSVICIPKKEKMEVYYESKRGKSKKSTARL